MLVVDEVEARLVQGIFDLYLGRDGPPKGLKAIGHHLNELSITRRGRRFGTGSLHALLTNPAIPAGTSSIATTAALATEGPLELRHA